MKWHTAALRELLAALVPLLAGLILDRLQNDRRDAAPLPPVPAPADNDNR